MSDSPSPSSRGKRSGLLSGAFAYLNNGSKSKDKDMKRGLSDPTLKSPETPRGRRSKSRNSMNDAGSISSSHGESSEEPQTPRAKQKVRRMSLGIDMKKSSSPTEPSSVTGSVAAVSPGSKSRRAASLGPMEGTKSARARRTALEKSRPSVDEKEKKTRSKDEGRKTRSSSVAPQSKDYSKGDKEK
eukprot:CAMPEP_0176118418 /NCGR_PEP_ID=MMETSP0120_2-20121206/59510_1 /TAXON_ID=160619 /ORGANISM="Kryptoperidinium foliaceum, Strain CCMP 1326" /LENGTH=185 /DNA_ID=CAMNT_0017452753 /DNA_START=44 /DNA_END=598 /DNA_ORIENTATION=-